VVFYLIIAGVVFFVLFHYRNQLMFWKISNNRIVAEINSVAGISDPRLRFEKLKKLKSTWKHTGMKMRWNLNHTFFFPESATVWA
jgi:hypothetical protein